MVSAVVEDLKTRWTFATMKSYLPRYLFEIYKANDDKRHPWSDITEIIPGEADVFCAALAAQNPGTAILTSDSDLFLFDLGPDSAIIFFDTIRIEEGGNKNALAGSRMTIKAMKYRPASIADRLGIPALSYLAHELKQSSQSKLAELVRRAKIASDLIPKTPAYLTFLEEYDLQNVFQYDPSNAQTLQDLDTRISELFVQYLWTNSSFQDQNQAPRIYLPFLVEDHSRKCAWAESVGIRRLAYSLLNLNTAPSTASKLTAVTECVRRGRRFCFDKIDLYSMEGGEIEKESGSLLEALESFQRQYHLNNHQHASYDSSLFWRTYALYEINKDWFTTNNHPSAFQNHVALKSFLGLDRGSKGDRFDNETIEWDDIHALAQLQAGLYSLRMVYQIIQGLALDRGSLGRLRDILAQLPPLHVLMRSFHEVRRELYGLK